MDVNNIMKKENNKLIIGLAVGAVAVIAILLMTGVSLGPLSIGDRADLRLIAQPYLESSGLKDACLASGAAWTETADYVGCDGMGPNSCSSPIVIAGQTQCIGAGAEFLCETGVQGHLICKY